MNYTDAVQSKIEKLVGTLKPEDELVETLKRKLTKKEFKVFTAFENGLSIEDIQNDLKLKDDEDRINEIYTNTIKKLNQEKTKKELIDLG
ncbi:MAG: hypothetical protein ABF301_08000 [Sulfurovum sp.]|jgi:DNA-binding NarL/FixJ family response regulator